MKNSQQQKRPVKKVTVLGAIAISSTSEARKLLRKYGQEDAKNVQDLEMKLSKLYSSTDDKKKLEREIAEIHPHKDFILNRLRPVVSETPISIPPSIEVIDKVITERPVIEETSNCNCSGFAGMNPSQSTNDVNNTHDLRPTIIAVGVIFGFVTILALVLHPNLRHQK